MERILRWSLFSLAFVPLLFNSDTLSPFIFTKTLFIRLAITVFWVLITVSFFVKRSEVEEKIGAVWHFSKNPLYIFVSIFIMVLALSTVLAVDPTKAFFSNIERGEGLLGMFYFFGFFVATLLVFRRKDWITFFKLNVATGAILFLSSMGELLSGEFTRAQSFIGSPTFLAGYFLFVIFASLTVFFSSRKKSFWGAFSFVMVFLGSLGVFLTGTRGAILGLFFGVFITMLYLAVNGKGIAVRLPGISRFDLRRFSIAVIMLGVLLVGLIISTSDSGFWQKVPGARRFVTLELSDPTLQTRFISAGVSLDAINPKNNGAKRFLFGYGPENFNVAYNKYYDPEYLRYENRWFDRAHNKVLGVLVMNGVVGLLSYLGIWIALIYLSIFRIPERKYAASILFFGSAYFVHNLSAFDHVSTYIPFFGFLAFAVYMSNKEGNKSRFSGLANRLERAVKPILPYKFAAAAIFFSIFLVFYTFVPYLQSISFVKAAESDDPQVLLDMVDEFSKPYNYAQTTIRNNFISLVMPVAKSPDFQELVLEAVRLQEEYFSKSPYDPRDSSLLANYYRIRGDLGEAGAYEKSLEYELISLSLSPERQDHLFSIGLLSADLGDFDKAGEYASHMLAGSPEVPQTEILYGILIVRGGETRYEEAIGSINSAIRDPDVYFSSVQEINVLKTIYKKALDYFVSIEDHENVLITEEGARDFDMLVERIDLDNDPGELRPD